MVEVAVDCRYSYALSARHGLLPSASSPGLDIPAEAHRHLNIGEIGAGGFGLYPLCRYVQELALRCVRTSVYGSQETVLPGVADSV